MDKIQFCLLGIVFAVFGAAVVMTVESGVKNAGAHDACVGAGGTPQQISGATLCFAPGVLITPKE
jgi:hypothetical protein